VVSSAASRSISALQRRNASRVGSLACGALDFQQEQLEQGRADPPRERAGTPPFAHEILEHARDLGMGRELPDATGGDPATPQPRGHRFARETEKVFHHRIARVGLDLAIRRRSPGKDHPGPQRMPAAVEPHAAAARYDAFEHVIREFPARNRVIRVAALAPAKNQRERFTTGRSQVEEEIPGLVDLRGKEVGGFGPVDFLHANVISIHSCFSVSSSF
jgi:hypothetical protein